MARALAPTIPPKSSMDKAKAAGSPGVQNITGLTGQQLELRLTESLQQIADYQIGKDRVNIYAGWKPTMGAPRFEITGMTWQQIRTVCDASIRNADAVEHSRKELHKVTDRVYNAQEMLRQQDTVIAGYRNMGLWARLRAVFVGNNRAL